MPTHTPKERKKRRNKPVTKVVTRTAKPLQRSLARASRAVGTVAATPTVSPATITKRKRAKRKEAVAKRREPQRKALTEMLTSKPVRTVSLSPKKKKSNPGKVEKVLGEFKAGTLRSSSGAKVTKRKQAIVIGLSEARQAGEKVAPAPKKKRKRKK